MRVLVACEFSGTVRRAFRARGHDAWSCDLLPAEDESPFHLQEDVRVVLEHTGRSDLCPGWTWDLLIAHPPCTYLSSSGLHWNKRRPERALKTEEALRFVAFLMGLPIERIVIENPDGCIGTRLHPERLGFTRQRIQPHMFGEDASKWTALWIKGLPPLDIPAEELWHPGRLVEWPKGSGKMVRRWSNQTDSGQNRLGPYEGRGLDRARTYEPIAAAMAARWDDPPGVCAGCGIAVYRDERGQVRHPRPLCALFDREAI